jgi:4-hydroxybenzoate polyprenyltransferase
VLALVPKPWLSIALGLVAAGIGLALLGEEIGALAVGGLGAIILVALAFYTVGRSEDVEREREAATRRSPDRPGSP